MLDGSEGHPVRTFQWLVQRENKTFLLGGFGMIVKKGFPVARFGSIIDKDFLLDSCWTISKDRQYFHWKVLEVLVRYHCGGWSEEVNSCILNSYMVYL